jgi:hypothetical protein
MNIHVKKIEGIIRLKSIENSLIILINIDYNQPILFKKKKLSHQKVYKGHVILRHVFGPKNRASRHIYSESTSNFDYCGYFRMMKIEKKNFRP